MLATMSTGATGSTSAFASQAAELTVLPNGLKVLIQEDHRFPLVSMRLFVHAGSAYETPEESGISHLLEHMVFKGTEKRRPGQIAREIEGAGGYLNAGTSFDQTVYIVDLPSKSWALGLDVLKDMIFGMALDPRELEQEKSVVLSELERNEDNPDRVVFQSLQPLVWPGTGYARPVIGSRETLAEISREDILAYLDRLYQPQGMLLVVCGNVQSGQVLEEVGKLFGGLENRGRLSPAEPWELRKAGPGPQLHIESGPWKKVHVSVGLPMPGILSGSEQAIEVLAQMLGGDKTSRFYRKFKYDSKLVDEISVSPLLLERGGMLYLNAQLDPDRLEPFWSELLQELASLEASVFTDDELDRAKLNIEDSLFQAKETLSGLASKLGYFQFYENGVQAEQRYLHHLRRVDRSELQDVIDTHFTPSKLCVSMVLPEALPREGDIFLEKIPELWPQEAAAQEDPATQAAPGEPELFDLGGGGSLALIPDDTLPYTALTLTWPGGDLLLNQDQAGLAALAARGLSRGVPGMDAPAVREFLADRTTRLSIRAGRDQFTLHLKFPSRFTRDVLDLVREMVLNPTWPLEEVERAREEQLSDIVEQEDQPLGLMFRNAFPFLFEGHPLGSYHLGQPGEIGEYSREQLSSFWKVQRSQPLSVAVCGDFDRTRIFTFVKSLTKQSPETAAFPGAPEWTERRELNLTLAERNQSHLLVLFPVAGLRHEDTAGLSLFKTVMAGQGGVLFRELRDRQGLGYSVTAMLWQVPETGFLAFYIGTYPDKVDQALESFRDIVHRLQEEAVTEGDLERAKNLLQGQYYRERQSLGSRSGEAAELLSYGLSLDYQEELIQKAVELTAEDLAGLAGRYFQWDKAYLLKVSP